ncbi:hypothetical protein ACP70R_007531 [Stipagrostis hirtigluma subsp. patula]
MPTGGRSVYLLGFFFGLPASEDPRIVFPFELKAAQLLAGGDPGPSSSAVRIPGCGDPGPSSSAVRLLSCGDPGPSSSGVHLLGCGDRGPSSSAVHLLAGVDWGTSSAVHLLGCGDPIPSSSTVQLLASGGSGSFSSRHPPPRLRRPGPLLSGDWILPSSSSQATRSRPPRLSKSNRTWRPASVQTNFVKACVEAGIYDAPFHFKEEPVPEYPQQTTLNDCGMYVITYIENWNGTVMTTFDKDYIEARRMLLAHELVHSKLNIAKSYEMLNKKK